MEYWLHVAGKYIYVKFYTSFYPKSESTYDISDSCVSGLSCDCGLNCKTAIRRNATAPIVETMCYFNRKIGLPDLGIASLRDVFN